MADALSGTPDAAVAAKAGRVILNGYPTGLEVSPAIVHGGPYPATSDGGRSTSVGTRALNKILESKYPPGRLAESLRGVTTVARGPNPAAALREMNVPVTILEAAPTTAKEAQFRIRPEATVFDPSPKEFILARDPNTAELLVAFQANPIFQLCLRTLHHEWMSITLSVQCVNPLQAFQRVGEGFLKLPAQFLIRIQTQDPVAGCFLYRGILLSGIALPGFNEDPRTK